MADQKKTADNLISAVKLLKKVQGAASQAGAVARKDKGESVPVRR